jgi:small subunit ribosomal protein S6
MRRDPRVLRWTVLKLGDRVEDIARQGEQIIIGRSSVDDLID